MIEILLTDMIIKIEVGDHSGDGHEKTYTMNIDSSLSVEDLKLSFQEGMKMLGQGGNYYSFDFCSEYEDNQVPKEFVNSLIKVGIDPFDFLDFQESDSKVMNDSIYTISCDNFIYLWLAVAKIGRPNFNYKVVNLSKLKIGGYGLL